MWWWLRSRNPAAAYVIKTWQDPIHTSALLVHRRPFVLAMIIRYGDWVTSVAEGFKKNRLVCNVRLIRARISNSLILIDFWTSGADAFASEDGKRWIKITRVSSIDKLFNYPVTSSGSCRRDFRIFFGVLPTDPLHWCDIHTATIKRTFLRCVLGLRSWCFAETVLKKKKKKERGHISVMTTWARTEEHNRCYL